MTTLRRWSLDPTHPYTAELAADARLSLTQYHDDQIWQLALGTGESAALALQTQYGGRANLVSLVPMWLIDRRTLYQAVGYATPPAITALAPGYLQIEARLTPDLVLRADYRAMDSTAVGGRFTLSNTGARVANVRLDLFAHVVVKGKEQTAGLFALPDRTSALSLGRVGNLVPVVVLERGHAAPDSPESPKLAVPLSVPPGESVCHPSGWRLESIAADSKRITRARLHAPEADQT